MNTTRTATMKETAMDYEVTKVTTINLTTVALEKDADGIKKALNGASYMDFQVTVCPYRGELQVNVQTSYESDEKEIVAMILHLLAQAV